MYCTACGKQIIDSARFCNFCGSPVKFAAAPTTAVPVTTVENTASAPSEEPFRPSNTASAPFKEPFQSENTASAPSEEPFQPENAASAPSGEPFQPENAASAPTDEAVQAEYQAVSANYEAPHDTLTIEETAVGTFSVPEPGQITASGNGSPTVPESPAKPLPERKYTLGHIILCLCAAAIMAIVAGVFAGLYFSVV